MFFPNDIYAAAYHWVERGYGVIPISWRTKYPEAHLLPQGKWEPYKTQLPTMKEINKWFLSKLHNVALVMGWQHLVVLDFDQYDAYLLWVEMTGIVTYTVKTSRGAHVYLHVMEPVTNSHTPLLDVKANGYVLIPPSIHPSGHVYSVLTDAPILTVFTLSEVIPDIFLSATPPPMPTRAILSTQLPETDPWASAENQVPTSLDDIKRTHKIQDYFPTAERTSRDGRWLKARCPFHEDAHPSFWIDTEHQLCGCHVCGMKPMDVINLVSRLQNVSNQDAIRALARY